MVRIAQRQKNLGGGSHKKARSGPGALFSARHGDDFLKLLSRALNLREHLATLLNRLPQEMEQYQPFAKNRFRLFPQSFHLGYVAIFFHGSVPTLTKTTVN
jgi:hypothetical protein